MVNPIYVHLGGLNLYRSKATLRIQPTQVMEVTFFNLRRYPLKRSVAGISHLKF